MGPKKVAALPTPPIKTKEAQEDFVPITSEDRQVSTLYELR